MTNYAATTWINDVPPGTGTPVNALNMNRIESGVAAALPQSSVFATGLTPYQNRLSPGEAQPAFRFSGGGKIEWGQGGSFTPDANLYRTGVGALKTDGTLAVGAALTVGGTLAVIGSVTTGALSPSSLTLGSGGLTISDTNLYRSATDTLKTDDNLVVGGGTITIGADTNLYRSGTDTLKTDDFFQALQVTSQPGGANEIMLAQDGKVYFGSGHDTNLYRSAADNLKTDDTLRVGISLVVDANDAGGSLYFGSALDTRLYRSGANTLTTPGNFVSQGQVSASTQVVANNGQTTQILLANDGTLRLGNALDTSIYRGAANTVATGGVLSVAGDIRAHDGQSAIVQLSAVRAVPEIIFGNDGATSLYRGSANQIYNYNNLSQWGDFKAASFAVQSDRATKSEIAPAEIQVERMLSASVYTYERHKGSGRHLGLMSDELPDEVTDTAVTPDGEELQFVDVYKLATALLATVQHLDERLKTLEGKA